MKTESPKGCESNPCLNEAECMNTEDGGFRCLCEWGWTGQRCEICLTDCVSNPCPANAKCRAKYGGGYDCLLINPDRCADGFVYDEMLGNCVSIQKEIDLCPPNYCQNEGECLKDKNNQLVCRCRPGFTGPNCEIDIDECQLNNNACDGNYYN